MSLPRIIDFNFEELPLIVDLGVNAGLLEGTASINVWHANDWSVSGIALRGYRDRKPVDVPLDLIRDGQIYTAILHQLENGEFKKEIEAQIEREVLEDAA